MGLLDGKVVLITGAGGGIGRAHALACAREGARVVVNDLGGARDGSGAGEAMADKVVAEIAELGGEAVANHDSVTDPEGCRRMVQAALDAWGRLDVVVNNAGILRDRTFSKMTDQEWKLVLEVHLDGTRQVTKAALEALEASGGGAIVNTTSYSGMIGNFGQANYAAAKAGIYGLTRVLSMELRKKGITANCVAPIAKTRMTEDIERIDDEWTPAQISPMVVFLASDLARGVTGQVFGVQGQRIHLYEVKVNPGVEKPGSEPWTASEIAERLGEITAWEEPAPAPAGDDLVAEVFSHFPAGFKAGAASGWKANIQWRVRGGGDQTVIVEDDTCRIEPGLSGTPTCTVKTDRDSLLAIFKGELDAQKAFMTGKASADNMGDLMKLGMAFDFGRIAKAFAAANPAAAEGKAQVEGPQPVEAAEPAPVPVGKRYDGGYWLVEREQFQHYARATDDDNPAYEQIAPPMYHVRPFIDLMMKMATDPELDLDLLRLVHAEHDVRFHAPLRHGDVLQLRATLSGVDEKSSGKLVSYEIFGLVDGEKAVEGRTSYFIRGKKRADGAKKPKPEPEALPEPTAVIGQQVTADAATRYAAASGDENPIHVDPDTAKAAGLPGVILHGLATMAYAQRDIVARFADGDPRRLKRLAVRWAKPVFPGHPLTLKVWQDGERLDFVVENEKGQAVVVNGKAEIGPA